jgi:hypothetical protein
MKQADMFMVALQKYESMFIKKYYDYNAFSVGLLGDSTMDFLLSTTNEHEYRDKINNSFKLPNNDWLWLISCDLAEFGDMTKFRENSVAFVLWKEQLRQSFELTHGSMQYYFTVICGQMSKIMQIDGKVIHSTLKEAIDETQPGVTFAYAIRFCSEFFQNDHERCLSVIGTTFQPGVDTVYPPYFQPGSTFKKVDLDSVDHLNGMLHDMSGVLAYMNDKSTTVNMPTLENSKFALYKEGIIVCKSQTTTIFHVNIKYAYVGVLEINTGTMKTRVGYIKSSTYSKAAWFPSYNKNRPYSQACLYLTDYTPYVRRVMDDSKQAVQSIPPTPPTPTIFQFDMKSMETRENDEMLSLFTSTYTATSGAVVSSIDLISNKTTTAIASVYTVSADVVNVVGQVGVWVYDSTVAVVSAVWDLTKMSIYLVCVVLGVYLISKVGPGLKEVTQSSTKKRKLN